MENTILNVIIGVAVVTNTIYFINICAECCRINKFGWKKIWVCVGHTKPTVVETVIYLKADIPSSFEFSFSYFYLLIVVQTLLCT